MVACLRKVEQLGLASLGHVCDVFLTLFWIEGPPASHGGLCLPSAPESRVARTQSLACPGGGWSEFCQSVWSKFPWLYFPFREIIKAQAKAYESIFVSLILFIMHFINILRRDCALV